MGSIGALLLYGSMAGKIAFQLTGVGGPLPKAPDKKYIYIYIYEKRFQ